MKENHKPQNIKRICGILLCKVQYWKWSS